MGFIEDKRFEKYGAKCLFFDRFGGVSSGAFESLNVSFNVGDKKENVLENIKRIKKSAFCKEIGLLNQVHSDKIVEYDGSIYDADGFYTDKKGVFLGIRFADCTSIALMDTKSGMIMALHAGWRGTKLGIAFKGVEIFLKKGSNAGDILVSIGPHICSNCYEIKEDVASKFEDKFINAKNGKLYLNLEAANKDQLIKAGIKAENINSLGICTFENGAFFSYRRDGVCGRNIGGIVKL